MDNTLLRSVNEYSATLTAILEEWGVESLSALEEMDWGDRTATGGLGGGRARAPEWDFVKTATQDMETQKKPARLGLPQKPQPQIGDMVQTNHGLVKLGKPDHQGYFSAVQVSNGQPVPQKFLPQDIARGFSPNPNPNPNVSTQVWTKAA